MNMVKIIQKKKDGEELSREEINWFIEGYTGGEIPDYQASALLMAIYFKGLSKEEIKKSGFDAYFVDHTTGVYPQAASGTPWTAAGIQSSGDPLADLFEDLAAEQKARKTYDNLLRLIDDPDVRDPIKFLREREIVHFQRFGEALRNTQDHLDSQNFYAYNPAFDIGCGK